MADLDHLEAERSALKSALRSGARVVRHGEKSVEYRSVDELNAALAGVEAEIAGMSGRRRRFIRHSCTKGL